jgi:hypothetical protein
MLIAAMSRCHQRQYFDATQSIAIPRNVMQLIQDIIRVMGAFSPYSVAFMIHPGRNLCISA